MLKKYKFIKPFSTTISVGGVVGLSKYEKKIGDVIEGNYYVYTSNVKSNPLVKVNLLPKGAMPIQGAQTDIDIPIAYLKETGENLVNPKKSNTEVVNKSYSLNENKLLTFLPFLLAGSGAVYAYYKKFIPIQYALLIGGGLILGYGIKNQITYGNLIGWR